MASVRTSYAAAALALAVALLLGASVAAAQQPEVHAKDNAYQPDALTVPVGTTVRFVNDDADIHTFTARNGSFDSNLLFQGQTWQYVFSNPGSYEYFCLPHPWMMGTITVE
jgi:plastocyanin